MTKPKEIDAFDIIEPMLMRPEMYFGRKSITAFWDFYFGLQWLGGCGHGGPFMYKLRNDLQKENGFTDWVRKKRKWASNIDMGSLYKKAAYEATHKEHRYVAAAPARPLKMIEGVGFDLFVEDLKEFKAASS